jgi:hypothetical protein
MLTHISNAEIYAPEAIGARDVLIAGTRILAVDESIDLVGAQLERVDAAGRWLLPGFVDSLCHPCGGGGEGGFENRTPELSAASFISAGVACPVGALGTDSITRSLEVLYGSVMQPRGQGIDAHMYTGAYRVPAPTLTGDIARDLTLVAPVIGVGEVAIADHRSSEPTVDELRRLAADSRLGGSLPLYVDGELKGLTAATPDCLLEQVQAAVDEPWLPQLITALTSNPASALGLTRKGRIAAGADADLLLLEPGTGALSAVKHVDDDTVQVVLLGDGLI